MKEGKAVFGVVVQILKHKASPVVTGSSFETPGEAWDHVKRQQEEHRARRREIGFAAGVQKFILKRGGASISKGELRRLAEAESCS